MKDSTDVVNSTGGTKVEADAFLMDMDGVLVRGAQVIPGAAEFIARLRSQEKPFLILTNNSLYTPRDLQARLAHTGLDVPSEALYTSALATAQFLHRQCPGGKAYVIGEAGLTTALHDVDYVLSDQDPDYVVLGETHTYSFQRLAQAIRLVAGGARFIATNPDVVGPAEEGLVPATGAVAALISEATGVRPYFVGKPNPLMMRSALRQIGAHSESAVMIGDRMDTDIVAGTEAGMQTVLVLSGVARLEEVGRFPYRPTLVVDSVAQIDPGDTRSHRPSGAAA
jgi:NagD protein